MNIYIACGLTHVPAGLFEEHVSFIHGLANELRATLGATVRYALVNSDPHLPSKPANERPRLCYLWDRKMVEEADLIIAEASFPSTGLGIEMQVAEANDTPILLCYRDYGSNCAGEKCYVNPDQSRHELQIGNHLVFLMVQGVPSIFHEIRYEDRESGIREVIEAVLLLSNAGEQS